MIFDRQWTPFASDTFVWYMVTQHIQHITLSSLYPKFNGFKDRKGETIKAVLAAAKTAGISLKTPKPYRTSHALSLWITGHKNAQDSHHSQSTMKMYVSTSSLRMQPKRKTTERPTKLSHFPNLIQDKTSYSYPQVNLTHTYISPTYDLHLCWKATTEWDKISVLSTTLQLPPFQDHTSRNHLQHKPSQQNQKHNTVPQKKRP